MQSCSCRSRDGGSKRCGLFKLEVRSFGIFALAEIQFGYDFFKASSRFAITQEGNSVLAEIVRIERPWCRAARSE